MTNRAPSLKRNSIYNLAGHFFPLLAGFILIPVLIQNLGMARFGIITIVWAVIGYFSLFDFGLSRTITVKISQLQAQNQPQSINGVFWTSMRLILGITMVGSILLFILSFQSHLFSGKAAPDIIEEGLFSLQIIAFTLPAITLSAGIKGALEAHHRFLSLNVLQTLLGVLNFLVPFLISIFDPRLFWVVAALSILRYLFAFLHFQILKRSSSWLQKPKFLTWSESLPLLLSGGWFTVTNVVGPLMVYFDRFFLALIVPTAQLPFYTTPFEIVNRLLIIPSSITRALFPFLASQSNVAEIERVYWKGFWTISLISASIATGGILIGHWGLKVWLGPEFAENSYMILVIFLIGFAANAAAWSPFSLIQAFHRPDLSAKAHLCELPFYCIALYLLAQNYGLIGAALAWSLRNTVDLIIMFVISERLRKKLWKQDLSQL